MKEFVRVKLKDGQVVEGVGAIVNGTWIIESNDGPVDVYKRVASEQIGDQWINYV